MTNSAEVRTMQISGPFSLEYIEIWRVQIQGWWLEKLFWQSESIIMWKKEYRGTISKTILIFFILNMVSKSLVCDFKVKRFFNRIYISFFVRHYYSSINLEHFVILIFVMKYNVWWYVAVFSFFERPVSC